MTAPASLRRAAAVAAPLLLASLAACATRAGEPPAPRAPAVADAVPLPPAASEVPTLVVMITVDQLRPDYFERWPGQLTGGLGRMYRDGAVFTNAHHDHANTETAPGHAAVLSGRFPRSTGIVRNAAGVQDPQAPLIGARGPGASPFRFRGTTFVDWLRVKDPRSRALSVSRKDRGAILPIGREPQQVYWYASNGTFTTSTWYRDTMPDWVKRFNDRKIPQSYAGKAWTLLLDESQYPEVDTLEAGVAQGNVAFPHVLPSTPDSAAAFFAGFPWIDELTLQFALAGTRELDLGAGPQTDVVAVSLSATDAIGHAFGPDSREVHDMIVRLDRMLGAFMDSVIALRGADKVVFALTADHGVAPFPEVHARLGRGAAQYVDIGPLVTSFTTALRQRGVPAHAAAVDDGVLFLDRAELARAGVNADSLVQAFMEAARTAPGVWRVDRYADLARADTTRDAIARRWLNALPPEMGPEVVLTGHPYAVPRGVAYAMHGSPHDYDTHVPVILYGPPFRPGRHDAFARVVDIAPTLAWVTATPPLERLDGRVLRAALR